MEWGSVSIRRNNLLYNSTTVRTREVAKKENITIIETNSKGKAISSPLNTIVVPIIRSDFVIPMLESLKEHTPPNYRTIIVNQCRPNREFEEELYKHADYIIRTHYNLGFAQASNLGIRLAPSEYITVANDDLVFLPGWWEGCIVTFERFETAAACCPFSIKEPGWGWGEPGNRYLIPESHKTPELASLIDTDRALMQKVRSAKLEYEQQRTQETLDTWRVAEKEFAVTQERLEGIAFRLAHGTEFLAALVKEKNWMVVDGFALFCPVFKADRLWEIGLLDEKFRDGGGEDYCWIHRCYKAGYRAISTSASLCYHHWGKSKGSPDGYNTALPSISPPWNKLSTDGFAEDGLYRPDVGLWGSGERTDPEIYRHPL